MRWSTACSVAPWNRGWCSSRPSRRASSRSAPCPPSRSLAGWPARAPRRLARSARSPGGSSPSSRRSAPRPLNEVTKRCLRWRDAAKEVACEVAAPARAARAGGRAGDGDAAAQSRRDAGAYVRVLRGGAPALPGGVEPTPGRACLHGDPRRPHGPSEPHADPRSRRADARPRAPQPGASRGPVHRPRQLQGHQRHARPRRRRPAPVRGRGAPRGRGARRRRTRAAGRRRVRRRGRRDVSRRGAGAGRRTPARRLQAALQDRGRGEHAPGRDGQRRGRDGRPLDGRRAAARRRHRDVPGQVGGQELLRGVRVGHAGRGPDQDGARDGPARRLREGGVLPRLSTDVRPARDGSHRDGGPDPLAPPQARHHRARRVRSTARGDRPDHRGRKMGAGRGLPPGSRVAPGRSSGRDRRQRGGSPAQERRVRRRGARRARARRGWSPMR